MKLLSVAVALLITGLALPAHASDSFPVYTGSEFQELYEYAVSNTLPNLHPVGDRYQITGDQSLDDRIWDAAFERGYVLRPTVSGGLSTVAGVPMQPQAADAWVGLRSEARDAGMRFIVSSAYRSPAAQRTQFLSKLGGTSDSAIDATLTWYSVPGTSKHHSGYALDFRYSDGTFGQFRSTPDYSWLAEDNFSIPKAYGLIPSYPDDVAVAQGPNPEPWEFVWVGETLVACGIPQTLGAALTGPTAALLDSIAQCPGGPGTPEIPTWLGA
ncbi:MAG: D-alanyl-D-alanine carboxypeptidase family protein [Actinomycetota bacterium]|nr:D-alanyl-D-alanine carboxypeptidase family protein [Actinomycetota bacterium]